MSSSSSSTHAKSANLPSASNSVAPFVEVPSDLCCPIDFELFEDPVFTKSGDSYSRKSIERWFAACDEKKNPLTSPATNEILTSRELTPNRELRSRISKFRESLLSGKSLQNAIESGDIKKLESSNILKSDLRGLFDTDVFTEAIRVPALILAIVYKQIEMARWLLPHVDVNARSTGAGTTALHIACRVAPEIVSLLLESNADVDITSKCGSTPLYFAVQAHPSLVPLLISKGANVHIRTVQGYSPLMVAQDIATVKALMGAGADLFQLHLETGCSALFNVADPKYFCELVEFMEASSRQKLLSALRSTKDEMKTIARRVGTSANPRFIRAFLPLCLNSGGIMAGGVAGWNEDVCRRAAAAMSIEQKSDVAIDLQRLGIFASLWHGFVHSNLLAGKSDSVDCVNVLVELGGLSFINTPDDKGASPLLSLTNRILTLAGTNFSVNELQAMVRIQMTMIQLGTYLCYYLYARSD
jgi:hypothetical protein